MSTVFLFARILGPEDEEIDVENVQRDRNMKYLLSASNIALIAYQCWIECV